MYRISLIVLCLSLSTNYLFSTNPYGMDVLKAAQSKQLLFNISGDHDLKAPAGISYSEKMLKVLQQIEMTNREIHCLVETPPAVCTFFESLNAIPHLWKDMAWLKEKFELKKTEVEDLEKRKLSIALAGIFTNTDNRLLDYIQNRLFFDQKYQQLAEESFARKLDTITFEDVIDELKEQYRQILLVKEKWAVVSPEIVGQFNIYLEQNQIRKLLAELPEALAELNIQLSDKILAKGTELLTTEEGRRKRDTIKAKFVQISCPLLDLFLFNRVLELKDTPSKTIVILAGGGHISPVQTMLMNSGVFVYLTSYGGTDGIPLAVVTLETLLEHVEYFERIAYWEGIVRASRFALQNMFYTLKALKFG